MTRKARLAEGLRWPVRSADLQEVAAKFGTTLSLLWTSWETSDLRRPLSVEWRPGDLQSPDDRLEQAQIWIRPVAADDREWVHRIFLESGSQS